MKDILNPEPRDRFLAHFPERKRGTVSNWLLQPIRDDGLTDPLRIIDAVIRMLKRRCTAPWADARSTADAEHAITIMQVFHADARACAEYYIAYARLPDGDRNALKEAARDAGKRAWTAAQPPTDKQLAYLRKLGYTGDAPASMQAASDAIDSLLAVKAGAR